MHQPYGTPEALYLVHQVMVKAEMQRNNPQLHQYVREQPRNRTFVAMRHATGRALVALGTRLDPGSRSAQPTADVAIAGRLDS